MIIEVSELEVKIQPYVQMLCIRLAKCCTPSPSPPPTHKPFE